MKRRRTAVVAYTRPFTLLPPLLGIISGAVCAFGSAHNPDPARRRHLGDRRARSRSARSAPRFLNAASNVLNQITDLEVDRINKPERPLVHGGGRDSRDVGPTWILYVLAFLPTWSIVVPPVTGIAARALRAAPGRTSASSSSSAGFLFTLVYSLPSFGRTKRLGIWANLTIAIPRGCLLKVAGWTMVAPAITLEPWVIGVALRPLPRRRLVDEGLLRRGGGPGGRVPDAPDPPREPEGGRRSCRPVLRPALAAPRPRWRAFPTRSRRSTRS